MTLHPAVVPIESAVDGTIDTVVGRSRVMGSYRDSVRRLVAIDSVRMWSSGLAAEAGLGIYYIENDSLILRKNPFIWYGENQVSGDSIFIKMQKRKPRTVHVRGDAFAISQSDSMFPHRFDQLTGEVVTMHFAEGKIHRIDVDRTATSIYYLYEQGEDSTGVRRKPNGLNRTSGDRVVINFAKGKADRISVVGGVEGEYFPENLVLHKEIDYNLPGFNWREDHPGIFRKARRPSASVQSPGSVGQKYSRPAPKPRAQGEALQSRRKSSSNE